MNPIAIQRIADAAPKGSTDLDLRDLGLTTLPPEIGQLTALKVLGLADNQITTLPPELWSLTELEELYLSGNQLTALPPEITSIPGIDISAKISISCRKSGGR